MGIPEHVNWTEDEYWRNRRLSPAQLMIHDIRLEGWKPQTAEGALPEPMLEINPTLSSSLLPALASRDLLSETLCPEHLTTNRQEQAQLRASASEYGWMNCLRSRGTQQSLGDPDDLRKCRWM
jgi:hypothetical protein